MENIIQTAGEHGALGLTILAAFWFINKLNTNDVNEKKEMIQILLELNKSILNVVEKNTSAFIELKEAIKKN